MSHEFSRARRRTAVTMHEVRKAYPHPIPEPPGLPVSGTYCVGGALGAFLHGERGAMPFPGNWMLAEWLQEANPALTWQHALKSAGAILNANDRDDMAAAWAALAQALEHAPSPGTGRPPG